MLRSCVVPAQVERHVHGRSDAGRQSDPRQSIQDQHRRSSRDQWSEGQGRGSHQGRHGQSMERCHGQHRRSRYAIAIPSGCQRPRLEKKLSFYAVSILFSMTEQLCSLSV